MYAMYRTLFLEDLDLPHITLWSVWAQCCIVMSSLSIDGLKVCMLHDR